VTGSPLNTRCAYDALKRRIHESLTELSWLGWIRGWREA